MLRPDHQAECEWIGVEALVEDERGQSTLEYALVLFALLASITVLGALIGFLRSQPSFEAAIESSAHTLGDADPLGTVQDLVVF
ncbi:MAG: hypothetical protein IJI15_00185 [Atopobiaceae bacterium]|nr:hypothetical protein [Atopobiaceae bacterium]